MTAAGNKMRDNRRSSLFLQQQQQAKAIYSGTYGSIPAVRGFRAELIQPLDSKSHKRDVGDLTTSSKDELIFHPAQKLHSGSQIAYRLSATNPQNLQKSPDSNNSNTGKPKIRRRLALIPPIPYTEKPIPKHVVTIDTSKARGNTDVVRLVARDLGWRECPWPRRDQNCDVTWHAVSFYDQPDIYSGQVNKFPGSLEVFHKVSLFRHLEFMKQLFPDDFNFFPRTWLLPQQYHEFSSDVRQMCERRSNAASTASSSRHHKPTFIIKPSEGSQGEGIYLIRDPQQYAGPSNRSHVAQEYLANVLLLDGFKFDLRVYAVLRCLEPLEVHVCQEGLARFSTMPYETPSNRNLSETFMHLTNYSLNKRSATFNKSDKEDEGSKRKMSCVFRRMRRMGHDTDKLWKTIERIVCKTLMSVVGELKVQYQSVLPPGKPHPTCFQVLGFDILILKDLRPMLLEVNSNPSLSIMGEQEVAPGVVEYIPSIKDEEVKRALIHDTLILIAPRNKKTRRRRKKRHHRTQSTVEAMEVDSNPSTVKVTRHRNRKRERDISIHIVEEEEPAVPETQRSIFAENDKTYPRPYVRQETCRVFVEGQGEITNFESPPLPTENVTSSSSRDTVFLEPVSDRQSTTVLEKNKLGENEQVVAFMEGDVDVSTQPLPSFSYVESSEDDEGEEEESCLKEIFPTFYADEMTHLRLVDRLADLFIGCLSIRGCPRMGPTTFRMFARKCKLNRKGMTNAAIDILYIDLQRKWEFLNPDRTAGLCFQGFVDGCYEIAKRKFYSPNKAQMMGALVTYCEDSLKHRASDEEISPSKFSAQMLRATKRPVTLFPRRMITSLEEETPAVYPLQNEKSYTMEMNNLIRDIRNRTYVPCSLALLKPGGE